LRLSDARFRDLAMMSSDWFWEQDRDLRFIQMSGGFRDRAGGSPDSTLGKTRWELSNREVSPQEWAAHQAVLERHESFENFCYRMRDLAGDVHWLQVAGKPLFDDAGNFIGYRGTGRDITVEKRREAQSVNELQMLELLAQNLPCQEFLQRLVLSYEAIFPDVMCSILLLDASGRHLRHGAAPSLPKAYCEAIDGLLIGPSAGSCGTAAFSGQRVVVQDTLTDPRWADYRDLARTHGLRACWSTPIVASQGRVLGTFAVYHREPTAPDQEKLSAVERGAYLASLALERADGEAIQHSLEGQLRESQKMQAIGTLAGGIAHDFNNIVAAILGNVELARQDAAGNRHMLVSLDEIAKAGQRARNLTQQILSFSRRQPTARRLVAPGPMVEEACRLLRATLPARVEMDCEIEADLPAVLADPTQISQVLLNLGTNAAYAIGARSGRIRLRVDAPLMDAHAVKPHVDLAPGRYVRISVSDNGSGMDATTLERIFEPFFTTKPVGEGTGLGLSVAHGIMRNHEGLIVARSEPGTGSVFELYIPASEATPAEPAVAPLAVKPGTGEGRHVLYIDDDEAMVLLVERMLGRRGYRVTARVDAEAALALVRAAPNGFDLVVTDFNMPGLSGLDVARQVRAIRPDLPVAVTSGFISEELSAGAPDAGVCEIIFKPDTVEEMCDVIQRLLVHQPGPA
jgi:PAS domain S-box-containing protein